MAKAEAEAEAAFNKAVEDAKNLKCKPSYDEMLEMHALRKQATEGDNKTAKPGTLDLREKDKYDAWKKIKGVKQTDARMMYVELVKTLK